MLNVVSSPGKQINLYFYLFVSAVDPDPDPPGYPGSKKSLKIHIKIYQNYKNTIKKNNLFV